ncbi:GyrI-like domain-containing protein [Promicromonospora sukumoe]|uniref:GyrI-like domain-containing protein n=1 Tax=Promicromonospora sukumoe TaxID=88382 RepID=UPI00036010AA|nr:GyrI-like domain-containing protein [Promicromonospora sukumoe]
MSTYRVETRPETATAGITDTVTMSEIARIADRIPEVAGWIVEHGSHPAGAPYFRYQVIDMDAELVVEVGFPVPDDAALTSSGDVTVGAIPAGRYVTTVHHGHPDSLVDATGALLRWAEEEGLTFDRHDTDAGDAWAGRLELYLTDPAEQPDMAQWDTELAFKLAD